MDLHENAAMWTRLRGLTCTCPPNCTTGKRWGDGPRPCAPDCEPCRIMINHEYAPPGKAIDAPKL